MRRSFKIGVALTVLVAVAAVLIAPTIVMPMTTLRVHHRVSSHAGAVHAHGGLLAATDPGLSHLIPSAFGSQISVELRTPNRALSLTPLVLLC